MELMTWSIEGTLKPDGTLDLDEKPPLRAGRVKVTVVAAPQPSSRPSLLETMEKIWSGQKARGYKPRSKEEIDAEIEKMREESEEEMQAVDRIRDECMSQLPKDK